MSGIPDPSIVFAEECDSGTLREEDRDSVLHVRINQGDLLMVAGGIGGGQAGAIASRLAVDHFYAHIAALARDYPTGTAIQEAAELANQKILEAAAAMNTQMGSTLAVALLREEANGSRAWVGPIGDCRAYLVRAERLNRLTTDHSAAQSLLSRGLIAPEELPQHPDALVPDRLLGHQPQVKIDIEEHPLAIGDTLLLCSGGLWSTVPDREIESAVTGAEVETCAHKLLELALNAGGHGNIAIEMARLIPPPVVVPQDKSAISFARKLVLTVFLLAAAGLCVLLYAVLWRR
jgi:serine/threonine protein phosphatase PrpC